MGAPVVEATFTAEQRQKLADKGASLPDGSFPIRNASDLKNAVQALGRAKDQARAKAHIVKRAKALGLTSALPDEWQASLQEGELWWTQAFDILSEHAMPDDGDVEVAAQALAEAKDSLAKASTPEPFSTSKTSNWVARVGGLPPYIQHIAHDLVEKRGKTESNAIQMAIGIVKNWCSGQGNVDKNTRAAACKAVAEWEAKKAKNKAKGAAKAATEAEVRTWFQDRLAIAEGASADGPYRQALLEQLWPEEPEDVVEALAEEVEFGLSLAEALGEPSGSEESGSEELEEAPTATININAGTAETKGEGEPRATKPGARSGERKQPAGEPAEKAPATAQATPEAAQTQGNQTPALPPQQPPGQLTGQPPGQSSSAALMLQPGLGRSDERVSKLQARLAELGHEVKADGVYGDLTTKAVRDFQLAVGLDPTGAVDEATVGALRAAPTPETGPLPVSVVRPGSAGEPVKRVQKALSGAGYDAGQSDGSYGKQTREAVKGFQREHGLKPDGVVGRHTARMLDAVARLERAQGRVQEAAEERANARDGYEFCGALARERVAQAMVEASLAEVCKDGHGRMPEPHPHDEARKRKGKKLDSEVGEAPDSEMMEASAFGTPIRDPFNRFTELLHPRNRVGQFRDKPSEPRSRSLKWYETPRVAPGGMPRPLLPHGSNPAEPTSGKANLGLQLRTQQQGGAFGISPTKGSDGIPAAVGMEGLKPFHDARVGNVGRMQTKDLKLALAKAREYGSRSVQKKVGAELVKRGVLGRMPESVGGLRSPGVPADASRNLPGDGPAENLPYGTARPSGGVDSRPDSIRTRLARLAGSSSENLPRGQARTDPSRKGGPQSVFSAPLMPGAGRPAGTTDPVKSVVRSPGVADRRARFPELNRQIGALGVGQKADLGHGVVVERREGGYYANIGAAPEPPRRERLGRSPSGAASYVNRVLDARMGENVLSGRSAPDGTSAAKASPPIERPLTDLTLGQLGAIIDENWPKVNYAARPYLDAMKQLNSHTDQYGADRGDMIVAYFLSNASGWRGEVAKAVKKELKRRIG